jgi:hypothetical protein
MKSTTPTALLRLVCVLVFAAGATSAKADDSFPPLFPFVVSHEAPDNVTSMAHLLEAPAGKHGFVRVENGRFVNDAGPIRFNGTNLTGAANFPSHEDADRLADRLARFGINIVRLHYFDAPYGNLREDQERGLFGVGDSVPQRFRADPAVVVPFDPEALDRLDYLIAALKKRGIYVNINLHVARLFKGRCFINASVVASEKEFARRLLTHVNPYTGLAYTDEPAVAMIEINNENSLIRSYRMGWFDRLPTEWFPEPSDTEFRDKWNEWLGAKYASSEAMWEAWGLGSASQQGKERHGRNPAGASGLYSGAWQLVLGTAQATASLEDGVMRIQVTRDGDGVLPKLMREGLTIQAGETYTISFRVRRLQGNGALTLGTALSNYSPGWRSMGFHRTIEVGNDWTEVEATFTATETARNAVFELTRLKKGTYELADLVVEGATWVSLRERLSRPDGAVEIIRNTDIVPPAIKHDFYQYLVNLESAYWRDMADYISNELKAKAPVSGTQLGFSWASVQKDLDYVDTHSYWAHPDSLQPGAVWRTHNISQVNCLARFQRLAGERVFGKPYTVSEYNHPFPNQYGAEGQPMLRAYGALQGWDGVFQYTWHHRENYTPGWNSFFFSISERTDVLAHMPAAATMYLRGDVREAGKSIVAAIDYDTDFARLVKGRTLLHTVGITSAGFDSRLGLIHKTAVDLDGGPGTDPASIDQKAAEAPIVISDTGELTWNREVAGAGYFTVNTDDTKLFSGFPGGRTIALGEVSLEVGPTRLDWATVSLVSRFAGGGFGGNGKPASILLAATGLTQNTGMELERLDGDFVTARNNDWGRAPVLTEGIPAVIQLPAPASRTRCFALDPNGDRVKAVPVEATATGSRIVIGPQYQTIWYEIEIGE